MNALTKPTGRKTPTVSSSLLMTMHHAYVPCRRVVSSHCDYHHHWHLTQQRGMNKVTNRATGLPVHIYELNA
jgi:hypothetical protein